MRKYMHAQMIVYFIGMSCNMHPYILLVELQGGRQIKQELRREKEFLQK